MASPGCASPSILGVVKLSSRCVELTANVSLSSAAACVRSAAISAALQHIYRHIDRRESMRSYLPDLWLGQRSSYTKGFLVTLLEARALASSRTFCHRLSHSGSIWAFRHCQIGGRNQISVSANITSAAELDSSVTLSHTQIHFPTSGLHKPERSTAQCGIRTCSIS